MTARISRRRLPRSFCARETTVVARDLLGRVLARRLPSGAEVRVRLVETEAYLGVEDPAAHTFGGRRTERVAPMWGAPGHAYVYLVYGMHHCLNVVTRAPGEPEAVLLRAAEPASGAAADARGPGVCAGPGRLCRALGIDRGLSGASLQGPELWLEAGSRVPDTNVLVGPRVGVDYAGEAAAWPLRFALRGSPAVTHRSGLRPLEARAPVTRHRWQRGGREERA